MRTNLNQAPKQALFI